eukprot:92141_1
MGASSVAPNYGLGFQQSMSMSISMDGYGSSPTSAAHHLNEIGDCDACPHCRDTCNHVDSCMCCQKKLAGMHAQCRGPETSWFLDALSSICQSKDDLDNNGQPRTYTMCQLRRHNHADSAWILVGDTIYDATPYIRNHPGGTEAILKKSGGVVDCTEDLQFHSKRAQREWRKHKVGTLVRCPRGWRR